MNVNSSSKFEKSFVKFTKRNSKLKSKIKDTINLMSANPYNPVLKTHQLSGKLVSYLSCSCGFDCRIIFTFIENEYCENEILLLDIGKHSDVY